VKLTCGIRVILGRKSRLFLKTLEPTQQLRLEAETVDHEAFMMVGPTWPAILPLALRIGMPRGGEETVTSRRRGVRGRRAAEHAMWAEGLVVRSRVKMVLPVIDGILLLIEAIGLVHVVRR
jgi:hypothetical protein